MTTMARSFLRISLMAIVGGMLFVGISLFIWCLKASAGSLVPDDVVVGQTFPVTFVAEKRDGSGTSTGATFQYAVGQCPSANCVTTPELSWWNGTDYTGLTPTWYTLSDVDTLGSTMGYWVAFHTPLSAVSGKYLTVFIKEVTTDTVVKVGDRTLVHPEARPVWPVNNVVDLTNEAGDQNPTTTSFDTDLTTTLDFTAGNTDVLIGFPSTAEDSRQNANCNIPFTMRAKVTGYNTTTKVVTVETLPAAPDYRCVFRFY